MLLHDLCTIAWPSVYSNRSKSLETPNSGENRQFYVQCDLEIWQITLQNNRTPLLCYFKLCASNHSYWLFQTGVTIWKRQFGVKISDFFVPCELWIWRMTLENNRALLCYFKLCASFQSHRSIQTGFTVRKCQIWVKIRVFFVPFDFAIWRMTLKNDRAPLLCPIKLCVSFHRHMWIPTWVTVQKWLHWVLTSVTLTFDLWPSSFTWITLLSMVITPENFMMIQWEEHCERGVTDRRKDRQTNGQK